MAQYGSNVPGSPGNGSTCDVTNGSSTVTINGVDATSYLTAGGLFAAGSDVVSYEIASVSYASPDTTVTLSSAYAGTTATGIDYVVNTGFTANRGYARPDQGDVRGLLATRAALVKIDADMATSLQAATTTQAGQVELATNAETQTGTDTDRAVTPAGLSSRSATTSRTGLVELATQTETNTGTDTDRAVTPATLGGRTATTTRAGIVEKATEAEMDSGVTDKFPDAAEIKDHVDGRIAEQVDSVSNLRSTSFPASVTRLYLSGYYGVGTPGGGHLYYDSGDTITADNGITVFVDSAGKRWKRVDKGYLTPEDAGVDATGATSAVARFQALRNLLLNTGGKIVGTAGSTYLIDDVVVIGVAGELYVEMYGVTLDLRHGEDAASEGKPAFAFQGSGHDVSLTWRGGIIDDTSAGTNADFMWFNSKSSLFDVQGVQLEATDRLRHGFVNADWQAPTSSPQGQHVTIEHNTFHDLRGTGVILTRCDAPSLESNKFKDLGEASMIIGQTGDRTFKGVALSGTCASVYTRGNQTERNEKGGIVFQQVHGGCIEANDFESNNEGLTGAAHVDTSGLYDPTPGFVSGIEIGVNTFSGDAGGQLNIRCQGGTVLRRNSHRDGDPCIQNTTDNAPVYAPDETFFSNVTTRYSDAEGVGGVVKNHAPNVISETNKTYGTASLGTQITTNFTLDNQSLVVYAYAISENEGSEVEDVTIQVRNETDGTWQGSGVVAVMGKDDGEAPANMGFCLSSIFTKNDDAGYNAGDVYSLRLRNKSGDNINMNISVSYQFVPVSGS